MNWMRPSSTASMAGSASGFILTNHCVETSGSTMVLQRWHFPTAELVRLGFSSRPSGFEIGHTFFRASKRSSPA
jgi:hypothetical protein